MRTTNLATSAISNRNKKILETNFSIKNNATSAFSKNNSINDNFATSASGQLYAETHADLTAKLCPAAEVDKNNLNDTNSINNNHATSASGPSPTISLKENVNKTSTTNLPSSDAEIEKIKDNDKNNLQSSDAEIAQIKNNDKNIEITKDNLNNKNKLLIKTPITGHIDILQIRNGLIHILDYKPEAKNQNPIDQLTIYALALASRTKLDLYSFKCAWFDENNYYEFFPLHAVYPRDN